MSYNVIFTPDFLHKIKRLLKKYPSIKKDIQKLHDQLVAEPTSGKSLGMGFYKVRMAISSKNSGKSGGARVITYVVVIEEMVYLASIYDKSEQEDITSTELQSLLKKVQSNK